ncbi:MAG: carbohydrate binding family 9 domain-containing protein [Acidobacteriota bacterium]|nr:carbohydrate binding family 9 domain-containing protein [Acidobacteriota bacterium]
MLTSLVTAVCLVAQVVEPSNGRTPEPSSVPMALTRVTSPIVIDAVMDDEAWRGIAPLPLTMYAPVFKGQPTQRSEIRVAYDEEHVYFGGWFYDTDPSGIRINSLYRDRWNGDDTLAIYIDAFNDNQNAKWFGITPAGMRFDLLVSDDGLTLNDNWDSFWTTEARITDEGWFVEVRIPFSSLGFQPDDAGRAVMGLTVTRLVSRLGERVTFPEIDPRFQFRMPSRAQDVVLQDVRSRKPFFLTPYVLGGAARSTAASGTQHPARSTEHSKEIGLDARYPLSSQLTLDLTANTDFAQVEADDQQVALDRFPLFFPERRRFFQENAGVFDFVTAGGGRLFHSRRIGLAPDLQPVRILGGARLVGRIGAWDVGMLNMQTEDTGALPGENFGVLRVRRPVLNPSSTAGLMATTYVGGGRHNVALGADTSLRMHGDQYVGLKWAATTDDRDDGHDGGFVDSSLFDAKWERRTQRGLSYTWQLTRSGEDYRPELGFAPRTNFTTANVVGNWYFFTDTHTYFRRVYPGALVFNTFRNTDRELESGTYAFWVQWDAKSGDGGWLEPKWFRENVLRPFTIGGTVNIPAGVYDFADFQVAYLMNAGRRVRADVDVRAGTYFDGRRTQVILSPTWNVSRHLELGAAYQLTSLRFDTRGEKADIQLLRLRIRTALNVRASGNAFLQYNSTTDRVDVNVRLRYNVTEGTDLWIVYNEGLDTEREILDGPVGTGFSLSGSGPSGLSEQRSPLSLSRALIVKYSHTFTF